MPSPASGDRRTQDRRGRNAQRARARRARVRFVIAFLALVVVVAVGAVAWRSGGDDRATSAHTTTSTPASVSTASTTTPRKVNPALPGMPPIVDPSNVYSESAAGKLSAAVSGALERVYVPNRSSNSVSVIDPKTMKVVDTFSVGNDPQHVVPSWDLKTLWVTNNSESNHAAGSLTPIDPLTGKPGAPITVEDPYNLYFTPDGKSAIVVAEGLKRLDFRDPKTMALQSSIATPNCAGVNHADFSLDGSYVIFTCEFQGNLVKIDLVNRAVIGYLALANNGMPQDIRVGPNGRTFYIADMAANGVYIVDGDSFTKTGFLETGPGAHGAYPSRNGQLMYIVNRGYSSLNARKANGPGSVSVIDTTTNTITANWPIPGGGSPDMGNINAAGTQLWLSGRADNVVYMFDTKTGAVTTIPVGKEPHGLAVWPQPGRYSLGHTGIMR